MAANSDLEPALGRPRFRWLTTLRRRLLVQRRPFAAVFAALAVLLSLRAARAPGPLTVEVWTASRDLSAGQVLGRGDLAQVPYRQGSAPEGVISDPGRVLGRTVAGPVRRGEPMTDFRVLAPSLLSAYPGKVATPVRLSDPAVVSLLHTGDVVDLVAADPQGATAARTVASGATVIAVPPTRSDGGEGGLQGRLVLFAVPSADAAEVTAAGAADYLTVLLKR